MKKSPILAALIILLAGVVASIPANADSALYSNLGSGGSTYSIVSQWTVAGSASPYGFSQSVASLFTVAGSGSLSVSQVDLAVGNIRNAVDTFDASIWTNNAGHLGNQVTGAFWSLSAPTQYGTCCSLVSVNGIAGVTLTGGQQYFMLIEPLSPSDGSWNGWNWNNQGASGLVLENGFSAGTNTLGAFDVLSGSTTMATPEPSYFLFLASGLASLAGMIRRKIALSAK